MTMVRNVLFVLLTVSIFFSNIAYAQQNPDEKLIVRRGDIPDAVLKDIEAKQKVQQYGWYVGFGKEIGIAVNEGLRAINEQTAAFGKTEVGKFTMFIIAYKVIGQDLIQFAIGFPLLLVGIGFFVWSFYKNCITRKILQEAKPDGTRTYKTFEGNPNEKWAHAFCFLVFLGICAAIIFV